MKKIFVIIAVLIVFGTCFVCGATFNDIEGLWAEAVINEMAQKGIINGFEDGTFRPEEDVSREQFAKILVESFNIEELNTSVTFQDVEEDRWSREYVSRATKYMTDYIYPGQYWFRPEESCTRAEVAKAVVKAYGLDYSTPDYTVLNKFSDVYEIREADKKYVAIAIENELMRGKGEFFDPQSGLKRAEVCQLIFNVYQKIEAESILYGDVNSDEKINSIDVNKLKKYLNTHEEEIDFRAADVNCDEELSENDIWILKAVVDKYDVKLPHICSGYTETYTRLNDEKHEKIELCNCGSIKVLLKTEKHKFKEDKCVCGALDGNEYIILEEFEYRVRPSSNTYKKFVEIQIGSGDFVSYQDDDIVITPKPDEINTDKFGNLYAYYDINEVEEDTIFKVSVQRRVTSVPYVEKIPTDTNTNILEGFEIYIEPQERIDSNYEAIVLKAKELTDGCESDYEKAKCIFEYVNVNLESDLSIEYANKGSIAAIENLRGSSEEFSTLFVAMCRAVEIPSRAVSGYELRDGELINILRSEIYLEKYGWVPVDSNCIYMIGSERVPYFDSFCKLQADSFIVKNIYNYEKASRTMRGVTEESYTLKLINKSEVKGYDLLEVQNNVY